mmetsp:Transcript_57582/g.140627  ORF Transcript_57582/g.140627 Transcript_57582/m.140627 type:complete len:311 (+) Transcript_57582:4470-5402(+)
MTEDQGSWASVGSNETQSVIQISDLTLTNERVHELESKMEASLEKVALLEDIVLATVKIDSLVATKNKEMDFEVVDDIIKKLLRGAKVLDMHQLRDKVVAFAEQIHDEYPSSTVWFLATYDKYEMNDASWEERLMSYIRSDPKMMLTLDDGRAIGLLGRDRIVSIISDKCIYATESTLLEILTSWVGYGGDKRIEIAKTAMNEKFIDLSFVSPSALFSRKIRDTGFVSESLIIDALEAQYVMRAGVMEIGDEQQWSLMRKSRMVSDDGTVFDDGSGHGGGSENIGGLSGLHGVYGGHYYYDGGDTDDSDY